MNDIQKVEDLFKKIKKDQNLELYSALDLIYRCGIEQKEVCTITIGDVEKKGNSYLIDTHAQKKNRIVEVDGAAYTSLQNHFKNAKLSLIANSDSPLFPKYNGISGAKTMRRHCKKYSNKILPKGIRSAGIKSYDKKLSVIHSDEKKRQEKVAEKFRFADTKYVKNKLNGKHKGASRPKMSKQKENDIGTLLFFDRLVLCYHPCEIYELCIGFYNHITLYNFTDSEKKYLIQRWEDIVSQQIPGKFISNQSKKNTSNLSSSEKTELFRQTYMQKKFDKELIEKTSKKLQYYFFPKVRHSILPKKQTSFPPYDKHHFRPKIKTSLCPKSKNRFFSKRQSPFNPKDKHHFLPKIQRQTSSRPKSKKRSPQKIDSVAFPTCEHQFLQRLILAHQRKDSDIPESLKILIETLFPKSILDRIFKSTKEANKLF